MMELSRDPAFPAVAFATPQTGAKKPGFLGVLGALQRDHPAQTLPSCPGEVSGIQQGGAHAEGQHWMAGTSPAMTIEPEGWLETSAG
jgi:hypothetical protein